MFQNLSKSRKEMEELSAALESLINGEAPSLDRISEDTLPSKIQSQILRLHDKMRGSEQALLREREEIRGLIADTAHQLRTPLANMESYLSLLKEESDSQTDEKDARTYYIRAIAESEEKIRFLTEGFIKMARLENGIIQIRKDSTDLQATLLGSILQAKKAADEKHSEIRLTMGDEKLRAQSAEEQEQKLPGQEKQDGQQEPCVLHDPQWLGEAVFNLLDNSIKYSPDGSIVDISVVKNEMFTRIEVRDAGSGIDEGEENQIFRRFYRGKRAKGQNGFGLGLYLSREIVQRHGGFMKVKRLEQGLSVGIYLPEQHAEPADRLRKKNNNGKL